MRKHKIWKQKDFWSTKVIYSYLVSLKRKWSHFNNGADITSRAVWDSCLPGPLLPFTTGHFHISIWLRTGGNRQVRQERTDRHYTSLYFLYLNVPNNIFEIGSPKPVPQTPPTSSLSSFLNTPRTWCCALTLMQYRRSSPSGNGNPFWARATKDVVLRYGLTTLSGLALNNYM